MSHEPGAYLGGIRTVEDLRLRSRVDSETGCWHWRMGFSQNSPSVHLIGPTGKRTRMRGRRAALYLQRGKDLRKGQWAYAASHCESMDCVNPAHARHGDRKVVGRAHAASGIACSPAKTSAARATMMKRRKLLPAQVIEIRASKETTAALALKHGVSEYCVWAARRGVTHKYLPPALPSVFSLGAAP